MIIYVDIDETICEAVEDMDYSKATPIEKNITIINNLFDEGHTIVYWTARGSKTGLDWSKTTHKQIKEWGAKCHEVRLGKPHYDLFICDKAINSYDFFKGEKKWLDA